jgi:AcrR family transcriptional regulator
MRAVAAEVGVSAPAIYLHFANKDELLHAVCAERFRLLHAHLEAAVEGVDDPVEQLRRRGRAYVDFGLRHPEHYRLLFMTRNATMQGPNAEDLDVSGFAELVRNVERCIAAGAVAPVDPVLAATGLWVAVHGVTSLAIAMPTYAPQLLDPLLDHLLEVTLRGMARRSSREKRR